MKSNRVDYQKLFLDSHISFLKNAINTKTPIDGNFELIKDIINNLKLDDFNKFEVFSLKEAQSLMSISLLNKDFKLLKYLYYNFEFYFDKSLLLTNTSDYTYLECSLDEEFEGTCLQSEGFPEDIILKFLVEEIGISNEDFSVYGGMFEFSIDHSSSYIFKEYLKQLGLRVSKDYSEEQYHLIQALHNEIFNVIKVVSHNKSLRYEFLEIFLKDFLYQIKNKETRQEITKLSQDFFIREILKKTSYLLKAIKKNEIDQVLFFLDLGRDWSKTDVFENIFKIEWYQDLVNNNEKSTFFKTIMKIDDRFNSFKKLYLKESILSLKSHANQFQEPRTNSWLSKNDTNHMRNVKRDEIISFLKSKIITEVTEFIEDTE